MALLQINTLLLTCRFTRDSSTFFFRKLLGMTWFDMLCLRLKYQLLWGLSTASLQLRNPFSNHPIVDQKNPRPGSQGQNERPRHRFLFFFCRPSHFLGQLWPRSSKKKNMWRIETMAQRISSPPKKIPPK